MASWYQVTWWRADASDFLIGRSAECGSPPRSAGLGVSRDELGEEFLYPLVYVVDDGSDLVESLLSWSDPTRCRLRARFVRERIRIHHN